MSYALTHRGPDDHGFWIDREAGIGLAHRRLSILDLSPAGHQPMMSASGRYVIAYNGEIYNHLELRQGLTESQRQPNWRGHSDTETLLAGFDAWGIARTIEQAGGMFAFAVWDKGTRTLTLGRDRVGEKPLYWGWQGDSLLFGSELKALAVHRAFRGEIDRSALALLMRHNVVPAPYSIYRGIGKLSPGTLATFTIERREPQFTTYWDARKVIANGLAAPFAGTPADAVDALEQQLRRAVKDQMIADVPLGAFLSGGVDSSTIVALMQARSSRPVRTFTIGFQASDADDNGDIEAAYNEADHAKAVATHLGTTHTELYVSPRQAMEVIPKLPGMYCEPFADSSQIPTLLVSQLARQHVTVALTGDAGDELFGGYNRYVLSQKFWRALSRVPTGPRRLAGRSIASLSPHAWNQLAGPLQRLLLGTMAQADVGEKLHKAAGTMASRTPAELYLRLSSQWPDPSLLIADAIEPPTVLTDGSRQPQTDNFVHQMMALDLLTYLPDDILCKVDRAAMAVSLETRIPFLDHRVVEFAWSLPLAYKLRGGVGKWPLRQVLERYVPRQLIERPKMGFGIPIVSWLRGPLRDWAEDLLSEGRLRQDGTFNPGPIRAKWKEHLSGRRNWQHQLWTVLMYQAWSQK